jgi:hypothetical protein
MCSAAVRGTRAAAESSDKRGGSLQVHCFSCVYRHCQWRIHRLDFAEKGESEWLYLGENESMVILP